MKRNDQREHEIVVRYQAGATMEAIARHYHITRQRVQQILKRAGVTGRPCPGSPPRVSLAHVLDAAAGVDTYRALASTLGYRGDTLLRKRLAAAAPHLHRMLSFSPARYRARAKARRRAMITTVRTLHAELGRTPSLLEVAERHTGRVLGQGQSASIVLRDFVSRPVGTPKRYATATRRLYRLAGCTPRAPGWHGHRP